LPDRIQSLTLVAQPGSLQAAQEFARRGAAEAKLPEDRAAQLDLIIEEILMNLSLHAYPDGAPGEVTILYSIPAPGELRLEVADQGREFDPLAAAPPDLTLDIGGRPIGGLGIFLVRSFTDSLSYRREQGWNRLTFAISAGRSNVA
jgi:anti-sigma regulatory factor (Ser/Thr protein kinase)